MAFEYFNYKYKIDSKNVHKDELLGLEWLVAVNWCGDGQIWKMWW